MSVSITDVEADSLAEKKNILAGEQLLKINGHDINDVLDYRFFITDSHLKLEICDSKGDIRKVLIKKPEYEDIGLEFETYLMDKKHSCRNKCIFCFIDQLPQGLRDSLYFKDDDERLSFLMGNYITLTNLKDSDVKRIVSMHISPINISVHTTNPLLRIKMMNNPHAGEALSVLKQFASAGTLVNCQLVLCRGINDGFELERSLLDLSTLYPAVQSVAIVPVGLTKYRKGLYKLESYDKKSAQEVLEIIENFGDNYIKSHDTRLAFAADEFYIKAEKKIPEAEFYEELSQLENGVGMISYLNDGFKAALEDNTHITSSTQRRISIATGIAAKPFIDKIVVSVQNNIAHFSCKVYAINNDFFGENITVAGLITGTDLVSQLLGKDLGEVLLIPAAMLRHERDIFLDSVSLLEVEAALNIKVVPVENDGFELLEAMIGKI